MANNYHDHKEGTSLIRLHFTGKESLSMGDIFILSKYEELVFFRLSFDEGQDVKWYAQMGSSLEQLFDKDIENILEKEYERAFIQ